MAAIIGMACRLPGQVGRRPRGRGAAVPGPRQLRPPPGRATAATRAPLGVPSAAWSSLAAVATHCMHVWGGPTRGRPLHGCAAASPRSLAACQPAPMQAGGAMGGWPGVRGPGSLLACPWRACPAAAHHMACVAGLLTARLQVGTPNDLIEMLIAQKSGLIPIPRGQWAGAGAAKHCAPLGCRQLCAARPGPPHAAQVEQPRAAAGMLRAPPEPCSEHHPGQAARPGSWATWAGALVCVPAPRRCWLAAGRTRPRVGAPLPPPPSPPPPHPSRACAGRFPKAYEEAFDKAGLRFGCLPGEEIWNFDTR